MPLQDIWMNLHKEHGKPVVQRVVDQLVADNKIKEKINGKQKCYVVNQVGEINGCNEAYNSYHSSSMRAYITRGERKQSSSLALRGNGFWRNWIRGLRTLKNRYENFWSTDVITVLKRVHQGVGGRTIIFLKIAFKTFSAFFVVSTSFVYNYTQQFQL